ncbi:MAG: 4Fe-4S dicluster domain-containing protein [Bacteroides sp.]|nr:4Fe-4S dicluster domain-containing protein [Eubacterium sp.]MCM1419062.1 4Fe-4S dicluster domain-containing protein [Roseburia sp.]MCM1461751.1 4Fe-4S dicluster domain-containing protein [Bacteroides sp.]
MIDKIIQEVRACTGCAACYNICPNEAITIELTEGFYRPSIDQGKCVSCKKCVKVCPQNRDVGSSLFETRAYAAKNTDAQSRIKSTSGGIFPLMAEYILNLGGVVYGVAFSENYLAKHIRIEKEGDLSKIRGSKYLQSYVGDTYKKSSWI